MERLGRAIPQSRDREVAVERTGASEIQSKIKSSRCSGGCACHAGASRLAVGFLRGPLAQAGQPQIPEFQLMYLPKNFYHVWI